MAVRACTLFLCRNYNKPSILTPNKNCNAFWKLSVSSQRYFSQGGQDLYKVLGLNPDASPEEIKRAYYKLAKLKHPDQCSNKTQAHREFTELQHAYSVLSDPDKRKLHDRQLGIEDRFYQESPSHFHGRQRRREQRVYEESPSHFRQRQERAQRMTEEHQRQQQQRPPSSQSREQVLEDFDEAYEKLSQEFKKTLDFTRFMKNVSKIFELQRKKKKA